MTQRHLHCTRRILLTVLTVAALIVAWRSAHADCDSGLFLGQTEPRITFAPLAKDTRTLCSRAFAVLYSGITLTPLWSAEHLTREEVREAHELARIDRFHPDRRVRGGPQLSDYSYSGFDRGHMTPNADMPDDAAQEEAFALTNIIPQDPGNNRHLWADIERAARGMVTRHGEAYIVTGPAYLGDATRIGRVAVPTYLWKAIYVPRIQAAGAWFTPNKSGRQYEVLSIAELTKRIGVDPFPTLPEHLKANAGPLYQPREYSRTRSRER